MQKDIVIVGIDIGSTKITTIIATANDDSQNIIGASSVESRGLRKGQVVDIEEAVQSITQSLEAAERMAGYSVGPVFVSVNGVHIESQTRSGTHRVTSHSFRCFQRL